MSGADGYTHQIFISYERGNPRWEDWMRKRFLDFLETHLSDATRRPQICIDKGIEPGMNFVRWLGNNLSRSHLMIAVWSEAYFESPWCQHELDLMLDRNAELIIPIVVQNCERLPGVLGQIHTESFLAFRHPVINKGTSVYNAMGSAVKRLVERIRNIAIPTFDANWVSACNERFAAVYEAEQGGKALLPIHYELPIGKIPNVLPRLAINPRA
jgi:hypothetical protein